jgi:L-asparagine oxygenase
MPNPVTDIEGALAHARAATAAIPRPVLEFISRYKTARTGPGMLIFRNLPTDPMLPATPTNGRAALDKESFFSEGRLLTLAQLFGEIFGYRAERGGDLIHNTAPIPGKEDSPSSSGSQRLLEAHTEFTAGRHQRVAPEHLALTFLRGDPQAATFYADAGAIYERLGAADREIARRSSYRTAIPESFTGNLGGGFSERLRSLPHPIFSGPDEDPEIILDAGESKGETEEEQRVIDTIVQMLGDPEVFKPAVGGPGDLFLLHNRRGIHGRSAFSPIYNGAQRWPQRVYVISAGAIHDNRERFDEATRTFVSFPVA